VLFAPQLSRYRLEQALTQEQLAARAHVDRSTVSRAETGHPIRVSSLGKLARALRVKPIDLQQPLRQK
jgi:transcriptional regulator with XRE-family HTH domain